MREPFAQVALGAAGARSELFRVRRPVLVQRLVEIERYSHPDERHARRAAEVVEHPANQVIQFRFIDVLHGKPPCGIRRSAGLPHPQ